MIHLILTTQTILEFLIAVLASLAIMAIAFFIIDKIQVRYDIWRSDRAILRHRQRCERAYEERLQQKRRQELHKREREKYPLFYWKNGIV